MNAFCLKNRFRIVGATFCALLHLLIIAVVELKGGEGPGFFLLIIDFPIVFFWNLVIGSVGSGGRALLMTCYFGGTFIYALVGWFVGAFLDRFFPHDLFHTSR